MIYQRSMIYQRIDQFEIDLDHTKDRDHQWWSWRSRSKIVILPISVSVSDACMQCSLSGGGRCYLTSIYSPIRPYGVVRWRGGLPFIALPNPKSRADILRMAHQGSTDLEESSWTMHLIAWITPPRAARRQQPIEKRSTNFPRRLYLSSCSS